MIKPCRSLRQSQERIYKVPSPPRKTNPDLNRLMDVNRDQTTQIEELKSNYRYLETQLQLQYEQEVKLQNEMNELRTQNKQLLDLVAEKNFKLEIEQKDVNIYQGQVLKLEEECNFQLEKLKTQKLQIDTLQEKVEGLQNRFQLERQMLKQQLMDRELEGKVHQSECKRFQEEVKQLKLIEQRKNDDQSVDSRQKLDTALQELDQQVQVQHKLNGQIQLLQQQVQNQGQLIKEERSQFSKEKAAIESYYLDQLQKQDQQLQQLIKSSVQQEHKLQISKLQQIIEGKEKQTKELEKKNVTLVMEVERLNGILKQKLTELESMKNNDESSRKLNEEVELWRGKFITVNKQYHASQEQLMVVRTELDTLKKPRHLAERA